MNTQEVQEKVRKARKVLTEKERALVIRDYTLGASLTALAQARGVTPPTILNALRKAGVKSFSRGRRFGQTKDVGKARLAPIHCSDGWRVVFPNGAFQVFSSENAARDAVRSYRQPITAPQGQPTA